MSARDNFRDTIAVEARNFPRISRLENSLGNFARALVHGKEQYTQLELARNRAESIRHKAIENLDKYLLEFESTATRNGIKILWAPEKKDALNEIEEILKKHKVQSVVKTKSSVCEEIGLSKHLEQKGIRLAETDVADVILKKTGDTSSHLILPAIHKSYEEIAPHFGGHEKVEKTVSAISDGVRNNYFEAGAGITGCNFLIAESGSVALTENEGNIIFTSGIPAVHIIVAGIDKVIHSLNELDTLWPLLSTYGTGQKLTAYNTIINGPRTVKEADGPQEVYVILVDNGRTELLAKKEQRPALTCIKCGACANVCPVYKTIGGQAFDVANPGPIGAVSAQHTKGEEYRHLSDASTLCGKCHDACPVNIELHNLLVENRHENKKKERGGLIDSYLWNQVKGAMLNRKKMNGGEFFKNLIIKSSYKKDWGEEREFPQLAKKSFNQLWKEKNP